MNVIRMTPVLRAHLQRARLQRLYGARARSDRPIRAQLIAVFVRRHGKLMKKSAIALLAKQGQPCSWPSGTDSSNLTKFIF
jgi:hypothetical protein